MSEVSSCIHFFHLLNRVLFQNLIRTLQEAYRHSSILLNETTRLSSLSCTIMVSFLTSFTVYIQSSVKDLLASGYTCPSQLSMFCTPLPAASSEQQLLHICFGLTHLTCCFSSLFLSPGKSTQDDSARLITDNPK